MGFSRVEKMEPLRNIRFGIRMKTGVQKVVCISDIIHLCEGRSNITLPVDKKVSFIGFLNEFDDVYGKGCVYIHLFKEADKEWLARRAIEHGATAVISEYQIEGIPCIVVDDVWHVLKELSRLYLDDNPCKRIAVAGSIGKTTTKEMIEAVLAQSFHEFCTPNNGNVLAYLAFEIQHMPRNVERFIQGTALMCLNLILQLLQPLINLVWELWAAKTKSKRLFLMLRHSCQKTGQ